MMIWHRMLEMSLYGEVPSRDEQYHDAIGSLSEVSDHIAGVASINFREMCQLCSRPKICLWSGCYAIVHISSRYDYIFIQCVML